MSDDEADPELLELLRKSLGLGGGRSTPPPPETKVLESAQFIFDNSIDVALSVPKTKEAAEIIWRLMQEKGYSTKTWSEHELHPKTKDESTVEFIFTMDLLNFSFWSEETDQSRRFAIEYHDRRWTGYWSLVAALQRALDEEIPITSPEFWNDEHECTDELLRHVFRSATDEEIPMFEERVQCLREAGRVLSEKFDGSFVNCLYDANHSAAALVNLLADNFSCFRDQSTFEGRKVRLYKRAQILVADLWACFEGQSYGEFHDIDKITMFADYRIPQMLHQLGSLVYSPPLESHIRQLKPIPSGSNWEIELRGTSIWCVELIRQEIMRKHPETRVQTTASIAEKEGGDDVDMDESQEEREEKTSASQEGKSKSPSQSPSPSASPSSSFNVNAILIDFFLYDTMKELEAKGAESIPHHRTRSIWY
ncbi:hypothetical protein DTO164E3_8524 [Paecilomyces variotii]|nr:hypothetical protein DTO164E3_8524 [Paecilomyces variotii]KAJ9394095.1 hypothetical protein DTO282F9_8991 [Paecilomyces variotii]KAJ9407994.1 hypothetical protein DTO045G8_4172 [Paecilomyces variotii]